MSERPDPEGQADLDRRARQQEFSGEMINSPKKETLGKIEDLAEVLVAEPYGSQEATYEYRPTRGSERQPVKHILIEFTLITVNPGHEVEVADDDDNPLYGRVTVSTLQGQSFVEVAEFSMEENQLRLDANIEDMGSLEEVFGDVGEDYESDAAEVMYLVEDYLEDQTDSDSDEQENDSRVKEILEIIRELTEKPTRRYQKVDGVLLDDSSEGSVVITIDPRTKDRDIEITRRFSVSSDTPHEERFIYQADRSAVSINEMEPTLVIDDAEGEMTSESPSPEALKEIRSSHNDLMEWEETVGLHQADEGNAQRALQTLKEMQEVLGRRMS